MGKAAVKWPVNDSPEEMVEIPADLFDDVQFLLLTQLLTFESLMKNRKIGEAEIRGHKESVESLLKRIRALNLNHKEQVFCETEN